MDLQATEWNIVVLGRWNAAIFSPFFVAKEIFENDDAVQIESLIPLDSREPLYRYDGFEIQPSSSSLVIAPLKASRAAMAIGRQRMAHTIDILNRTPISACGFNLRFQDRERLEMIDELFRTSAMRRVDAAAEKEPFVWHVKMAYPYGEGFANYELQIGSARNLFGFNFHLNTTDPAKAIDWLQLDLDECLALARKCIEASYQEEVNLIDEE